MSSKETKSNVESIPTTVGSSSNKESRDGINFQFKDGRRYHNEAAVSYVLPNDYDGNKVMMHKRIQY